MDGRGSLPLHFLRPQASRERARPKWPPQPWNAYDSSVWMSRWTASPSRSRNLDGVRPPALRRKDCLEVKHFEWIRTQQFEQEAQQRVLEDYLRTVEDQGEREARLTKSIVELVETWTLRPLVTALQALRGISIISATVLAAELGDPCDSRAPRN